MSSTGRSPRGGGANDFFPTPLWVTDSLLRAVPLPGGHWIEPCVGDGAIVRAVAAQGRQDVNWMAFDIRPDCGHPGAIIYDALKLPVPDIKYDVAITNPPFKLAVPMVRCALLQARVVVMLLRLSFLETRARADFNRQYPADIYVLPRRPSFTGKGTDSCAYAWFKWPAEAGRGSWEVLPCPR